jgi:hypothetical protein
MSISKRIMLEELEETAFWHYDEDGKPTPERAAMFERLKESWKRVFGGNGKHVCTCNGERKYAGNVKPLTKQDMIDAMAKRKSQGDKQ